MSEFQSITQMSAALQQGKISSRELTQQHLDGATAGNQALNCFISINAEAALAQADYADSLIADGSAGPMTGIPMAHKDIFCTQGIATTCASKMLENFTAPYNATVVEKLNKAGMVCIGKTNMDEFAMG
ncbi:MAG TPA: Asp-tRNA(Asn)/Glu-tRNA(Gln) amidotransferase GatCAB subunit A, partial [Gammaproteobacteria bacterium]|nr:Asp-tRNA(Asn)/Glu-tRNA(Gln) amidotransferase GatCAB subunit A [Gammaproteobacteria bacterium]